MVDFPYYNEMGDVMKKIEIQSSLYGYDVEFIDDFSDKICGYDKTTTAYVIDRNIYNLYKDGFSGIDINNIYMLDAVEENKNMDTVMDVIQFLYDIGVRKNWTIVCFGGGISQDITTMASNLFLRNVNWEYFPTTLLSMSDSCIGGKCGINYKHIKNQIGVFYPPKHIYIDTRFIDTLSKDDYINGWGEIVKFSLTLDESFYTLLKNEKEYIPCKNIKEYLYKGLLVKKNIIEQDEFESDLRRVLNYGHTFGHALEAYSGNLIPHGKGVLWGIDVVNYISYREQLIDEEYYLDIKHLICDNFIKNEIVIEDRNKLFELIKTDKKVKNNTIYFAALKGHSELFVYPMEIDDKLSDYFGEYLETTHEYYCH